MRIFHMRILTKIGCFFLLTGALFSATGLVGVYQVNVRLPLDAPAGQQFPLCCRSAALPQRGHYQFPMKQFSFGGPWGFAADIRPYAVIPLR
jgi:hypothetical protein